MIGELKHRVTIQEAVRTPDGAGGFSEAWQDIETVPEVYAAILPASGAEQLRAHQLEVQASHRIVMRYRDDVTPSHRLVKGAEVYNIVSVIDREGRGEYLDIFATRP